MRAITDPGPTDHNAKEEHMTPSPSGDETLVIALQGRMDTIACTAAEGDVLNKVRGAHGPVEFDMNAVDYVSSTFLRICITAAQVAGADKFALTHVHPEIKKVFKIANLDHLIRIS